MLENFKEMLSRNKNSKEKVQENSSATPEETPANVVPDSEEIAEPQDNEPAPEPTPNIQMIPLRLIEPDPNQPRKNIDPQSEGIQELAESIKKNGLIQPIRVREHRGKYIIVSGERRYTAHKVLGWEKIAAIILPDKKDPLKILIMQIQENLHRKDLNALEEAHTYIKLEEVFGLQQKEIVKEVNKDKSYISRMISLKGLSLEIQKEILTKNLDVSRRALWELVDQPMDQQSVIWEKIKGDSTEKKIKNTIAKPQPSFSDIDKNQLRNVFINVLENHAEEFFAFFSPQKMQKFIKKFDKSSGEKQEKESSLTIIKVETVGPEEQ